MKRETFAFICFFIMLIISLVVIAIEGYTFYSLFTVLITVLCFLYYLNEKIEILIEKIDEIKGK